MFKDVIDLENEFKKRCAREIAEYKAGKIKSCTMKVQYIKYPLHLAQEYNKRNDNDVQWFDGYVFTYTGGYQFVKAGSRPV